MRFTESAVLSHEESTQRQPDKLGADRRLSRNGWLLGLLFLLAFLLRLLARLSYGEKDFWQNSYSLFYDLAESLAAGKGLLVDYLGPKYAHRPPVYPVFLWLTMFGGKNFWLIVILQSAVGAGTAMCAYLIAQELFDRRAGIIAALLTACYPYYVMHDTALQETGLFTFLTALAIVFLLRAYRSGSPSLWAWSGIFLAAALLTRVTLSTFMPWVGAWLLLFSAATWRARAKNAVLVLSCFSLVTILWLARNYLLLGTLTLNSLTGISLWSGNNPITFTSYPARSIDISWAQSVHELPEEDRAMINKLADDEIAQDNYFLKLAVAYIKANPVLTIRRAFSKVGAGFSWKLNPARGFWVQAAYFVSYFPVLILWPVGMYLARREWRKQSLIYGLFLTFIAVTAVFYAHTSHRSYLDVYLIVFAAPPIGLMQQRIWQKISLRA